MRNNNEKEKDGEVEDRRPFFFSFLPLDFHSWSRVQSLIMTPKIIYNKQRALSRSRAKDLVSAT